MHTITHYDILSIRDVLKNNSRFERQLKSTSPFLGLVRIFENGKLNTDSSEDGWLTNMTIATGREFVAQSVFKKNSSSSLFGDISNYKVDSFGIGSGGSTLDVNGNVTLNGPALCDIGLYHPIPMNSQCISTIDNSGQPVSNIVKVIESVGPGDIAGSITFEKPLSSDFQECDLDYYTVVKNVCVIDNQEPTFLNPGESVKVDEAMLYLTSPTGTNPRPFAHICFAPKYIELETSFKIEWYVIC
jgi:hypothetical protein